MPLVEGDSEDYYYIARLHQVNNRLIQCTLTAGGTCTGEHGGGYRKIKYLEAQYGIGAVQMMKAIKRSLDPNSILNVVIL
jgi:D-lactate dehydrogenase (cytochrome)